LLITVLIFACFKLPYFQNVLFKDTAEEAAEQAVEDIACVGEKIVYNVMLGNLSIGSSEYRFLKKTELNGRPVNLITFYTKLARFSDRETIYSDPKTFLPFLVERKISKLIKQERIREEYDQENFVLTIIRKRWNTKKTVIKKDKPIHNPVLLPYFVRNNANLNLGWTFEVNFPKREYKIELKSIEDVKVPAGEFKAYYFESEPPQIKIWISKDARRIPLKIEGTGVLGYKLVMKEYSIEAE